MLMGYVSYIDDTLCTCVSTGLHMSTFYRTGDACIITWETTERHVGIQSGYNKYENASEKEES